MSGSGSSRADDSDLQVQAGPQSPRLLQSSVSAVQWNYLGALARILSQIVVQAGMARLLGPELLGRFSLALIPVAALTVVVDLGYSTPLIQAPVLERDQIRAAFTRVLLAGVALSSLAFLLAPALAEWLGDRSLSSTLRCLACLPLLQATSVVPCALLRRELRFKELQAGQMLAYWVAFLGIGLWMAAKGSGVTSVVVAWLLQAGVLTVYAYWRYPHSLTPLVRHGASDFRRFASVVLGTNICNWIIDNVDNLIVGRGLGARSLGLYNIPYNLVRTPANHLVSNLQSVLLPVSALRQSELRSLRRAYLAVLSSTLVLAVPTFLGVALVPEVVLRAIFGERWVDATPLLVPLALSMCCHAPMALAGPVLAGRGAPGTELRVQAFTAACLVLVVAIASRYSLLAVAWSVLAVYLMRLLGMTAGVVAVLQVPPSAIVSAYARALAVAVLTSAALLGTDWLAAGQGALLRLCLDVASAGLALVLALFVFPRWLLGAELRSVAIQWLAGTDAHVTKSSPVRRYVAARLELLS